MLFACEHQAKTHEKNGARKFLIYVIVHMAWEFLTVRTKHTLFNSTLNMAFKIATVKFVLPGQHVCLCWHLTFRPLRRAGLKPCGEPYGNHSSSRPQFACERSDRAAEPSGSRYLTSPWTLPAGSWTDRSASCSNSSAEGTIKGVDSKKEHKNKNAKDKEIIPQLHYTF